MIDSVIRPMTKDERDRLHEMKWSVSDNLRLLIDLALDEAAYWQQKVATSPELTHLGMWDWEYVCFWCGGERYYDRAREMYRVEHAAGGCVWLDANGLKEGEWTKDR